MRLVDADKMKADLLTVDPQFETMIHWCITVLDAQPTIELERKNGKWIHERLMSTTGGSYPVTRCSECQNALPFEWDANFCPNCGAKMEAQDYCMDKNNGEKGDRFCSNVERR